MILGMKKLKRTLRNAPVKVQDEARKAVFKNTAEGVRVAKTLAPDVTGTTRDSIHAKYSADRLVGSVEAGQPTKEEQTRAKAIEFGRKQGAGGKIRTNRVNVPAKPFIRPAQEYLEKRFRGRLSRAINKGMRAASRG